MQSFNDAKGVSRGDRIEELTDVYPWPTDEFANVRMIGPLASMALHWYTICTERNPKQPIAKQCLNHNPDTDETDKDICPHCKIGTRISKQYVVNVIVRDIQGNKVFPKAK